MNKHYLKVKLLLILINHFVYEPLTGCIGLYISRKFVSTIYMVATEQSQQGRKDPTKSFITVETDMDECFIIICFQDSMLVAGVAFKKTFSYAGFEMQPKTYTNPKIALLNIELELKAEKENAEVRVNSVEVMWLMLGMEEVYCYNKLWHDWSV